MCRACLAEKPSSEFNKNSARYDGLQSRCRPCDRTRAKALYRKNPLSAQKYKDRAKVNRTEARDELLRYISEHPCVDCGEGDITVLDFDHRVPEEKVNSVSKMFRNGAYRQAFEEIKKCDVRCANCHRRRTAKQFRWWSAP